MNNAIKTVLDTAFKVLNENREACAKDGYLALAHDMADVMHQITKVLKNNADAVNNDDVQAETYRQMHDIATNDLGYESILEALESTPHANTPRVTHPRSTSVAEISKDKDGKTYLVFPTSVEAEMFIAQLGGDEHKVRLECFGNFENAILIEQGNFHKKGSFDNN